MAWCKIVRHGTITTVVYYICNGSKRGFLYLYFLSFILYLVAVILNISDKTFTLNYLRCGLG